MKTDGLVNVMEASTREASQTPKLYDHSGAKKGVVWHYFGFIKAKDGPATKTYLDMTKAMYKLYQKSYTNQGEHAFINKYGFFILE